jgi:hypothetical protein
MTIRFPRSEERAFGVPNPLACEAACQHAGFEAESHINEIFFQQVTWFVGTSPPSPFETFREVT